MHKHRDEATTVTEQGPATFEGLSPSFGKSPSINGSANRHRLNRNLHRNKCSSGPHRKLGTYSNHYEESLSDYRQGNLPPFSINLLRLPKSSKFGSHKHLRRTETLLRENRWQKKLTPYFRIKKRHLKPSYRNYNDSTNQPQSESRK